jgi:hypothetical protein
MRLLVAESDPSLGTFLHSGFGAEHYAVDLTRDGAVALAHAPPRIAGIKDAEIGAACYNSGSTNSSTNEDLDLRRGQPRLTNLLQDAVISVWALLWGQAEDRRRQLPSQLLPPASCLRRTGYR